ncbi:uncharacterized protein LOC112451866 isoform X2 [Temnothorax curvispinosus]|uniref:Uncharacterized protein LOC112451866 isoform X2 n=1 Tax=Temnothorax curvispinosus TaxID=300111 RepID=A0A6J1PDM4_9HYME|nr:uncharacterized protein LOC112451866 isoform X2 [Temnothorax curvispinosus]
MAYTAHGSRMQMNRMDSTSSIVLPRAQRIVNGNRKYLRDTLRSTDAALSLSAALPDLLKAIRHVPNDHYAPVVKSQHMLMFISRRISALVSPATVSIHVACFS